MEKRKVRLSNGTQNNKDHSYLESLRKTPVSSYRKLIQEGAFTPFDYAAPTFLQKITAEYLFTEASITTKEQLIAQQQRIVRDVLQPLMGYDSRNFFEQLFEIELATADDSFLNVMYGSFMRAHSMTRKDVGRGMLLNMLFIFQAVTMQVHSDNMYVAGKESAAIALFNMYSHKRSLRGERISKHLPALDKQIIFSSDEELALFPNLVMMSLPHYVEACTCLFFMVVRAIREKRVFAPLSHLPVFPNSHTSQVTHSIIPTHEQAHLILAGITPETLRQPTAQVSYNLPRYVPLSSVLFKSETEGLADSPAYGGRVYLDIEGMSVAFPSNRLTDYIAQHREDILDSFTAVSEALRRQHTQGEVSSVETGRSSTDIFATVDILLSQARAQRITSLSGMQREGRRVFHELFPPEDEVARRLRGTPERVTFAYLGREIVVTRLAESRYVLDVNAGFVGANGLSVGRSIVFDDTLGAYRLLEPTTLANSDYVAGAERNDRFAMMYGRALNYFNPRVPYTGSSS